MARRRNRFADRAALEALLRFGPELSGLKELQRAAEDEFTSSVRGAHAERRGTVQAVRAARPEVRGIYRRARGASQNISDVIGENMAAVPASLQAAVQQEQTGFTNRMRESQAAALTDLQQQAVGARAGEGAAIRSARDQFAGDLRKILERKLDLARERGAFTSLRVGELRQEAQDRADRFALKQMDLTQEERNSLRSAGIDPGTGKAIPGGRLDPDANGRPGDQTPGAKKGRATRSQIGQAQDMVQQAIHEARTLRQLGASRGEIAEMLSKGAKDQVIPLHDAQGKPQYYTSGPHKGEPITKTIPGVPQIKSQLLLSTALDHVFNGYVSNPVRGKLHRRGLYVTDFGLLNARDYRRRHRPVKPHPHGGKPSSGAGGYPYGPGAGNVH